MTLFWQPRLRAASEQAEVVLGRGVARDIEVRVRCVDELHGEATAGGKHAGGTTLVEEDD
jgi:hypothetical protein